MKIAIDVRMMFSSGIGSYIRHLVPRIIQSLPDAEFYLLGRPREMEQWEGFAAGPRVKWIETTSPIFTLAEQWELFRKIPKDTDLFWSPHYNFPVFWRGKLLATIHDVFHLVMGKETMSIPKLIYSSFMFNQLVRRANALLCVSQFTKDELVHCTSVSSDKLRVAPNGVDESWFQVKRTQNPHSRPYVLFVGNVKPHKNLGRLLDAFALLKDRIPHDLILVGQKEGFITGDSAVFEKARSMEDRIQFTGIVSDDLLGQYYAFADLFVFPSLYEGFGLPPLEAMACGTPAVVSRAASIPEVCGDAAVYFDPASPEDMAEKILNTLGDQTLRQKLIQQGTERARLFKWDQSASETVHLLKSLF